MVAVPSDWHVSDESHERHPGKGTISPLLDLKLMETLRFLPPRDRSMLELRFRVGLTVQNIAALAGRSSSTVSRRLSIVSKRLHDPIVQALHRYGNEFNEEELEIALFHFAGGQSAGRISRDRRLPRRRVSTVLAVVRAWHTHLCSEATAARMAPPSRSRKIVQPALIQEKHHDRDE
jgi:hypothetical protein